MTARPHSRIAYIIAVLDRIDRLGWAQWRQQLAYVRLTDRRHAAVNAYLQRHHNPPRNGDRLA